jgi:hypothetical protein
MHIHVYNLWICHLQFIKTLLFMSARDSCSHAKHYYSCLPLVKEIFITLHIKLYNPVHNQTCLRKFWILINHCAGKLISKANAGIILQILPYQLAGIKLQLTPKTDWTISLYYHSRHWHRSDYKYGCYNWDIVQGLFPTTISHTVQWKLSLF